MGFSERLLRRFGLQRRHSASSFNAASTSRLNADWAVAFLSADQKIRYSLRLMRARSRELATNHDYAVRFVNLAKQNVIGPNGIGLQMALDADIVPSADRLNRVIESGWYRFNERVSADGRMSGVDAQSMWLNNFLVDGETFTHRIKGYPHNRFAFALQFIDPDQVDEYYNRLRNDAQNEIRMGVELDEWRRPVSYWAFEGHPAETPGTKRVSLSADVISHDFAFRMLNQTRGLPWMAAAMSRLNMLGKYEEAELVAARLAACKMAFFVSKTGDEYQGDKNKKTGVVETEAAPGQMDQLPEGIVPTVVDWNHPNQNFAEFLKEMLRGAAMGMNVSYSNLTGDLRDVNFSSIRQGILDERDGWRCLQTFAIEHHLRPVFCDWLTMAVTTGQIDLPAGLPLDVIVDSAIWTPRGWDWVDPRSDVAADITARRAGARTLAAICAKQGLDWRDVIDQIAKENEYAKSKGVSLDFTTSGAGGVEGDTGGEQPVGGKKPSQGALPAVRVEL